MNSDEQLPILEAGWADGVPVDEALQREWIVTNGIGGYVSGTLSLCPTRRYHGLLVASLPTVGRTVMLPRLEERAEVEGARFQLDCEERDGGELESSALCQLRSFRLRGLMPEWTYELNGARLERRLVMVHGENTVFVAFRHDGGPAVTLRLRPFPIFRPHEQAVGHGEPMPIVRIHGDRVEMSTEQGTRPPLRIKLYSSCATPFVSLPFDSPPLCFRVEQNRGYEHVESQYSPGYFECTLNKGESLVFGASTHDWSALDRDPHEAFQLELQRERQLLERAPESARHSVSARLILAADQFIIDPVTRPRDEAWARATGQDARSVIAGYHWFTDWGRDTMISLEGLALCTGRFREAAAILRTFQHYVRDGLLPNLFPEGEHEGLYHTADATLWFFHAIDRYATLSGDFDLVRDAFATLESIVEHHVKGTRFGIGVDPADGLLRQGAEGYQLTWMDAKVDGWVVTPRRGKAVEINALWFNALRLMAEWGERFGKDTKRYGALAEHAQGSFNRRFWNAAEGCLLDVVDGEKGDDPAVRPNQVFAISLKHPVLRRDRWEPVLKKIRAELLTPVGLRTLSPSHPDYKAKYDGDLRSRDAAYHQGTVWPWLLGHFVEATLKVDPDKAKARALLEGMEHHLHRSGLGQISEIFDASPPFRPRGCIAQAWSIGEMLRAWLRTAT